MPIYKVGQVWERADKVRRKGWGVRRIRGIHCLFEGDVEEVTESDDFFRVTYIRPESSSPRMLHTDGRREWLEWAEGAALREADGEPDGH